MKNGTGVTLNLLPNLIENSKDETNFPHKLLLTERQVSKIHKAFSNGSSGDIKFSKTQLSKIVQPGGILPFAFNGNLFIKASEGVFRFNYQFWSSCCSKVVDLPASFSSSSSMATMKSMKFLFL